MNRNNYQTYSGSFYNTANSYKSGFGATTGARAPLYPIGPSLPQPEFKPIQRGTSPYVSRQGLIPPSYEQRHRHQTTTGFNQSSANMGERRYDLTKLSYEERQRDMIGRNQAEIEEEHRRRQQIRMSYERQIAAKTGSLSRNLQRKQRLLAEVDSLSAAKEELHSKLMELRPPSNKLNTFEPIDRKQQEMIIMKNKLVGQMRDKEAELHRQEEQEEKFWQNELAQKEKILLKLELDCNTKRLELNGQKCTIQKPDLISIEDEVREEKYQDFIFEVSELQSKINRLTQERQSLTLEVKEGLTQKKLQTQSLRMKRQQLARQKEQIMLRVSDLERIGKQMEEANNNLFNELNRKESMITKYENDIQQLKDKKKIQESIMNSQFDRLRQLDVELIPGLAREITSIQDDLRLEMSTTSRLKNQYQRLYELLCSASTKNLHQTFGTVYSEVVS